MLEVVLDADVERNQLIARAATLVEQQQSVEDVERLQNIERELSDVYARMAMIGADSAETRAATILSGLDHKFSFFLILFVCPCL